LYINEVIPKELLKYIDTNEVRLGVSTSTGTITASNPIKLTVDPNGNGVISTKDTPELSIVGGDWSKVTQVRSTLDSQVFYGVLGQRRSYTIEYKLKSNVTNQDFAKALNDYITANNQQLNFESWLTADFVDSTPVFHGIRKPDGGKPNKRIQHSYTNAFLEVLDTDKDGLFDFVEDEIGSDKYNVDTDGDGVPDGQEYLTDKTDPTKANSYLVVKPNVTTTNIEANRAETIKGTVPKTIYNNPADETKKLAATNTDAGNVIVKAYKYVADDTDYTHETAKAETTIPFSDLKDGKFSINVPAGTFADGDKVILVAYSPDGKNPMVSSTKVNVGAIKVTFDTNGGKWADGTNSDKVVSAVNGKATQPEEPTRDGYKFMGWAATSGATEADADILKNITEAKEVFAVWKDNKAPVIDNIGDQTVIEGQPITEITVTTDDPTATVTVKDLPTGVQYSNGKISGTPKVTDWHGNEETREITVTVEAKDSAGNTSTKTFKITVQRDTDKDGIPDVTDLDDDGDGYLDSEETAKGSDPKNSKSVPAGMITPIAQTTVTNPIQTVNDKTAITNIVVTPGASGATVTVDNSKLPNGVTYDAGTKTISGTPNVTNWGSTEEKRKFEIPVVVKNPDGSKITKTVEITVLRDTDGDGDPDITDTDDDGDGYSDTEETTKGSDPKNSHSIPAGTITPADPLNIINPVQTVVDRHPINDITIGTIDIDSTEYVDSAKLPPGVTYNPGTLSITGTPNVTNWGSNEEKRKYEIPIVVTNSDGSSITRIVEITVLRDTDGDGDPDITDPDDDGDGYTDLAEKTQGSDPKSASSIPAAVVTPVAPTTITNGTQTVNDKTAITNIVVTPGNAASVVTVDNSKLPNGVTYDAGTKTISGTPNVT
ncbi:MAG: InlB B-repeat-containing protein, partial [Mogibacterium diversum]|nr:InlB B-repeat-containing protein [Mogibacterium diversum]